MNMIVKYYMIKRVKIVYICFMKPGVYGILRLVRKKIIVWQLLNTGVKDDR